MNSVWAIGQLLHQVTAAKNREQIVLPTSGSEEILCRLLFSSFTRYLQPEKLGNKQCCSTVAVEKYVGASSKNYPVMSKIPY
jgi:hypothetical protein